jgi:hypothetical protein
MPPARIIAAVETAATGRGTRERRGGPVMAGADRRGASGSTGEVDSVAAAGQMQDLTERAARVADAAKRRDTDEDRP